MKRRRSKRIKRLGTFSTTSNTSTQDSIDRHFLDLNEDCFYKIYNFLPIIDWCTLRETCTRLKISSDDCFKRQLNKFELTSNYIKASAYNDLVMDDLRTVIRNFGSLIPQLTINGKSFASNEDLSEIVPLLNEYCSSLQNLKIVKIEVDAATIMLCERLFSNLKRLVIDTCCDSDVTLGIYLRCSTSLKELELARMGSIGGLIAQHHKSLETLSLKSIRLELTFFQRFLGLNPQLKRLEIHDCDTSNIATNRIVELISDNLLNLEVLILRDWLNDGNLTHLHLTNLKRIEMYCNVIGIESFLNELATYKQIEFLHLSLFEITDESVKTLCNLKTLKVLRFSLTEGINAKVCKKLATELPSLLEMHIVNCPNTELIDIKEFAEASIALKKIVFLQLFTNRYLDDFQLLTKDVFLLLMAARQRNANKDTLNIFLGFFDYRQFRRYVWNFLNLTTKNSGVINVLPLETEDERDAYIW